MMMLAYHELSRLLERDVYSLPAETFRRHAYLVQKMRGSLNSMTFDDGHRSQFEIAGPILDDLKIHALFFVTTAWVGLLPSVMLWRAVRELQQVGHVIGSHTHTHPMLTACGTVALRNELTVSKQVLEQRLGVGIDSISIPGGRINARVLAACGEAGYKHVYTSHVGEHKHVAANSPEVIGRLIVRRATSNSTLAAYLAEDPRVCRRLRIESSAKSLVKAIAGDSLYQRLWRKAVRSDSYGS
jgi:peptidoglycan/xylan/chitin deacetylase (PgdA/CDA1 family)